MAKKALNIVEGPMGYQMPENVARQIEADSKGLPKDFEFRRLAAPSAEFSSALKDGSRTDISMVNTDDVDRDREVVLPEGLDLSAFRQSPTVFFNHSYETPVGACEWIKPKSVGNSNGLIAQTRYAKKPSDWQGPWLPDAIHSMMQEGIGTGKSIGFQPTHRRPATTDELAKRPDWKDAQYITDKGKLFEFSVAPLGCNPKALTLAVSKTMKAGLIDPAMADFLAKSMSTVLEVDLDAKAMPPSKYNHIDFAAPEPVRKCMAKGLGQHSHMNHNNATPEQLSMANHLAMGGKASPDMVRKTAAWWDGTGKSAHAQPEESPMHTLALLHGGPTGAMWAKGVCKSMDDANGGLDGDASGGLDSLSMSNSTSGAMVDPKAIASPNGVTQVVPAYDPGMGSESLLAMPDCPKCMSNLSVQSKGSYQGDLDMTKDSMKSGDYVCDGCGSTFDKPAAMTKAAAGVSLNREGFSHADSMIDGGKIADGPWSFTTADRHSAKPEDYLATDGSKPPDTESHWKYPVCKGGSLYRRGVAAAESRASALGHSEIADAAKKLMEKIQAKDAATKAAEAEAITQKRLKAIELAEKTPVLTLEESRRQAVQANIKLAKRELPRIIREELREGFARAAGRV